MTPRRRVKLYSLGCRLNEAELEDWGARFEQAGLSVVADHQPADLVVVNTCAVTREAARKSRQLLRKAQRTQPEARLIVSGCLATLEHETLAQSLGADLIIDNADKDRLVELSLSALAIPTMPALASTEMASSLFIRGRQRAFVKVQDGCRYQCTFCITTLARGAERSRPAAEVIAAVDRLHAQGIEEVVLTGVQLGGYRDEETGGLDALIRRLLAETKVPRIRLGSVEPWDLSARFWELFQSPRLMPHLHLPLQSGSDAVLKRMARRCKSADFMSLVATGRAAVPDLNITTDIIVGFPGETSDDWRRTLGLVERIGFGDIHVFTYSPRAGTLAATFADQVEAATKGARGQALQALAAASRHRVLEAQVGKHVSLLLEGSAPLAPGLPREGYTPNFLPVRIAASLAPGSGRLCEARVTGVDAEAGVLIGEPARRTEGPQGPEAGRRD